jgi:ribonuclease HI
VTTDGLVVFGVGYHSWVITTPDEKVILSGGGPDDGDPLLMTSYRSELGGLASALEALGMLERAGCLNIRSVKCVSDNQSAVRACKRKPTESIFHRAESDYDLLATITNLQADWCNGINIQYAWVRGHADSLEIKTTREERANITADELCDIIRETATGRHRARPNCGLYLGERCALFIKGTKITSNWKESLIQQLLDGDLR